MDIRKKSQRQEKDDAKFFGGKDRVASGAMWDCKGDVKSEMFLIEDKFTDADKFVFTRKVWDKISKEATKEGLRIPLLRLDLKDIKLVICDDGLFDVDVLTEFGSSATKSFSIDYSFAELLEKDRKLVEKPIAMRLFFGGRKSFLMFLRKDFEMLIAKGFAE